MAWFKIEVTERSTYGTSTLHHFEILQDVQTHTFMQIRSGYYVKHTKLMFEVRNIANH